MFGQEVKLKRRTVVDNFCMVCQSFLTGNGSVVMPYRCPCGEYKYDFNLRRYKHPKEGL